MPKVLISYRRGDTIAIAGRIFDRLASRYGNESVFMDIDTIPFGVDFRTHIDNALRETDVLVALIGPAWMGRDDQSTTRIANSDDPVRVELETALRLNKRVVPVLVEGTPMPKPSELPESLGALCYLNAAHVDPGRDFNAHMDRLIASLDAQLGAADGKPRGSFGDDAPPNSNIPFQLSELIGRETEVAEISGLIVAHRLVTIVGAGGIGKTRVALQVGSTMAGHYEDGVWLVELAPLADPALVAAQIATVLNVREVPGRPIRVTLPESLRRRSLMLILDNCEHLIAEAAALTADILQHASAVRILATSRESLGIDGESVFRMPSLALAPAQPPLKASDAPRYGATALFVERARAADADFALTDETAPVVAEICRRLDGIPLAIELAAARMRVLDVAALAQRLDERFRILTGGSRTALPRQQTMRALIDWSYELLTAKERALFRRLGIFAGGFALEAAEAVVCGEELDETDILDLLTSLVEKSLVVVEEAAGKPRYRQLESMRAYSLEKLDSSGEHAAFARRHAEWAADLFDRAHEARWELTADKWLTTFEPEFENALAAIGWAIDAGEPILAARIACGRAMNWLRDELSGEFRRWFEWILPRLDQDRDAVLVARTSATLGGLEPSVERRTVALEHALAIYERLGDKFGSATTSALLSQALRLAGKFNDAERVSEHGLTLLRELGMTRSRAYCLALRRRGLIATSRGDPDGGRRMIAEALELETELGDARGAALARVTLAEAEFASGDTQRAFDVLEGARGRWSRETSLDGFIAVNSAAYLIGLGRIDEACRYASEGLAIARRIDEMTIAGNAMQHLATVAALRGDVRRAARLLGYVDASYKRISYELEPTERRTHGICMEALREKLPEDDIISLLGQGAELNDDQALVEVEATRNAPTEVQTIR